MSSSLEAEKVLKKLRKLDVNMVCPNCGTKAVPGVGFGNVCVKFKTFICDLCKTSHQAISHRVKSFSMSTWTMDEVLDLSIERNGGNEAALHIWLENAPPPGGKYAGGVRPKSGDDVNVFKRFVTDCYEHGKFKASTPFMPLANESNSINTSGARSTPHHGNNGTSRSLAPPAPLVKTTSPKSPKSLRKVGSGSNVKPSSPDVDLLGFDMPETSTSGGSDFGSFSAAPSANNQTINNHISSGGSTVFDPFGSPQRTAPMSTGEQMNSTPLVEPLHSPLKTVTFMLNIPLFNITPILCVNITPFPYYSSPLSTLLI